MASSGRDKSTPEVEPNSAPVVRIQRSFLTPTNSTCSCKTQRLLLIPNPMYRPITSRQAKQEYRKAGGEPRISDAVRRQIARAAELEERAQKIRDAQMRKKDRRDKRLRKEQREGEARRRMGLPDPRIPKLSASQPSLSQWCTDGMQTKRKLCHLESAPRKERGPRDIIDLDQDTDVDNDKGKDGALPGREDQADTKFGDGRTYSPGPDELSDGSLSSATIPIPKLGPLPSSREIFEHSSWNNPTPAQSPSTSTEPVWCNRGYPTRLPTTVTPTATSPPTSHRSKASGVKRSGPQHPVHCGSQLDLDDGTWTDYSESFVSNTQIDRELRCASLGPMEIVETFSAGHLAPDRTYAPQSHTSSPPFESGSQVLAAISNHDGLWSSSSV